MALNSKVAIEVVIKDIKKIADLKKGLKELRAEQKKQEKESKSGRFQSKESAKAYKDRAAAIKFTSKQLRELNKDMAGATKATKAVTKSNNGMAKQFVKGAAAIGIVVGAFRAVMRVASSVISVFTEFEFVMAKVNAVSGATEKQFKGLTATAEELGRTTFFTATQVGELMLNFSKLGFSANEIQNAVKPTLDLATATGSDLARAAIVAGSAIRGFGLDADQTGRVTDVMAVSFSRSAMDIEKWQTSMTKVAPIAKAAGFSIEDTAAIMSKLADSGIEASIAGTSLRNILLKMQDPTSDLSQAFGGTIHSLDELVPAMEKFVSEGGDMAEILEVVDLRQAAAFEQMLSNTDTMITLRNEMKESSGEAERMAKIIGDTLQGSFLKFTSAMEGLSIAIMKDFVAGFQSAIDKVTSFTTFLTKNSTVITTSIEVIVKLAKWIGIYKLAVMSVIPIQTGFTSLVTAYRTAAISARLATITFAGALRTLKLAWQSLLGSTGIGIAVVVLTELAMSFFGATDAIEETTLATNDFIDAETRLQKIVDDTNTIMNQRYADTAKGASDSIDSIKAEIQARRNQLHQSNVFLGKFVGNIKVMSDEEKKSYEKSINRLETRLGLENRNLTAIQKRDFLKAQQEKDLIFIQEKKLKVAKDLSVTNEEDLKAKNILIKSIEKEISRLNELGVEKAEVIKETVENTDADWERVRVMKKVLEGTIELKDAEKELRDSAIATAQAELDSISTIELVAEKEEERMARRLVLENLLIDLKMKGFKEEEKAEKKIAKTREESIKDLGDLGSALQEVAGDNEALNGIRKAGEDITKAAAIAESILNLQKSLTLITEGKLTIATLLGAKAKLTENVVTGQGVVLSGAKSTANIIEATSENTATGSTIAGTVADVLSAVPKAIKAILSSAAAIPFPLNLIAIVATMALVKKVMKFEEGGIVGGGDKFASGGMVHGASHAQGGVKFAVGGRVNELEGGEAVINKRSTAMFRNQLSSMNQAGGGVKFADGGLMSSPSFTEAQFSAQNQGQMMGAMQGQKKVIVVEADITSSQSTVSVIQANASF